MYALRGLLIKANVISTGRKHNIKIPLRFIYLVKIEIFFVKNIIKKIKIN